jgi:hypothetical protein
MKKIFASVAAEQSMKLFVGEMQAIKKSQGY